MIENEGEKLGMDILDDFDLLEYPCDLFPNDMDLLNLDEQFLDTIDDNELDFSEVLQPMSNPFESVPQGIAFNPYEWTVIDQPKGRRRPPRLYEFLILLLSNQHYASYASYKDKAIGIFEIHEPEKVADLWQQVKSRQSNQKMTYDKFARAVRWYYKSDIMKKTNARYTFQFSEKTLKAFGIN